jgi:aromatic ring-opening dioxygenase LigB subunit
MRGALSIPSAPLLVDGVGVGGGRAVQQLRDSVRRVTDRLPDCDVIVLIAAGQPALHDTVVADLTGLGYPDHTRQLAGCPAAISALSRITQYPRIRRPRLPLDLAVLALLVDRATPVVALEVSASAEFAVLTALGTSVVQALTEATLTATIVAAGDLSAGLDDGAPLAARDGARAWDAQVVEAFTQGRPQLLAEAGPGRAAQVGARGWAPLSVLQGAAASASLHLRVRRYAAPRGVGYLLLAT